MLRVRSVSNTGIYCSSDKVGTVYNKLFLNSYCSSMHSYRFLCTLIVVYVFLDAANLTEVFP